MLKFVKETFILISAACSLFLSCGVSTGEVINSNNEDENNNVKEYVCENEENISRKTFLFESGESCTFELSDVTSDYIPILEICPPPFELHIPGEELAEKKPVKPGESYDNLLQPVASEKRDGSLLIITTDVPGVEVSLNNRYIGDSNVGIEGVTPRIYILGLYKEGYKEESLFFSAGEDVCQMFSVNMEKIEN